MSWAVGCVGMVRWRKGTKGSASGNPVLASNTVGWGEVIGRWAEVTGEIMSEAMKVKTKYDHVLCWL